MLIITEGRKERIRDKWKWADYCKTPPTAEIGDTELWLSHRQRKQRQPH